MSASLFSAVCGFFWGVFVAAPVGGKRCLAETTLVVFNDNGVLVMFCSPNGQRRRRPANRRQPATTDDDREASLTPSQSDFLAGLYGRTAASEPSARLAGTPNMFGDSYETGNGMWVSGPDGFSSSAGPLGGGGRSVKIAENDNCLPQDRVFFLYNHFHDAASIEDVPTVGPAVQRSIALDRYTIGFEKTFRDGLWSLELRMPFGCGYDYESADFASGVGQLGDLPSC